MPVDPPPPLKPEPPFQNYGDYSKEKLIRDLNDMYARLYYLESVVVALLVTEMVEVRDELGL